MIRAVYRVARSSVNAAASRPVLAPGPATKPGPKTRHSDGKILEAIRAILAACPFHGEGYRKVRARLVHRGLQPGGKRVLRLMRAHGLLAPRRLGPPNGNPAHDGTIITDRPDVMWGTDATRFYTERDGWCWFFGAIDHHLDEVVGWHSGPGRGRMLGDVEVDDPPAVMGEHDEDEEDTQAGGGTVKKSIETKSWTWLSRNIRQVCDGDLRGFGSRRETVRSATSIPSLKSSPWILGAPHKGLVAAIF